MLKNLLALLGGATAAATSADDARRRPNDRLAGARAGSKEITQRLYTAMSGERGVHIESLLCALGALAGYACQASVRAGNIGRGLAETTGLVAVDTTGGRRYYFGEAINRPLAGTPDSVWSLVAGQAQQSGCGQLPDVGAIFRHAAETVGSDAFGQFSVPPQHHPQQRPIDYVRRWWPELLPRIRKFCPEPEHWPVLLAFSIQEIIGQGSALLDPCLAARLVMESAIPLSKEHLPELDA